MPYNAVLPEATIIMTMMMIMIAKIVIIKIVIIIIVISVDFISGKNFGKEEVGRFATSYVWKGHHFHCCRQGHPHYTSITL